MFTPKNRDRFSGQIGEAIRDEFDNIAAQSSTVFQKEHNADGTHRFPAGDVVPIGLVAMWLSATMPNSKWIPCDGRQLSRTTYQRLFSLLGTTYGVGDGSTTFNAPDFRQRFPLCQAASGTGANLGDSGGAIDHVHSGPSHTHSITSGGAHTHSISASGDHTHSINDHSHSISSDGGHTHTGTTDATGDTAQISSGATTIIPVAAHTHTFTTGSDGSHNHDGATDTTSISANAGGDHSHGGATGSNGAHDHGGSTGSGGTGNTGTANPPYLVCAFILFTGVETN